MKNFNLTIRIVGKNHESTMAIVPQIYCLNNEKYGFTTLTTLKI